MAVAVVLSAHRAAAQPLCHGATSLDSSLVDAKVVVEARLRRFSAEDQQGFRTATLAVTGTLKGAAAKQHKVKVRYAIETLKSWLEDQSRLLVAITQPGDEAVVIDLAKPRVLTADFKSLDNAGAILQAAREIVRRKPPKMHFGVSVPEEALRGTPWASHFMGCGKLTVPVDSRLEKRSVAVLASDSRAYSQREQAVRALRHFKSAANIALVKAALKDNVWAYRRHAVYNDGIEVRYYGIRAAAVNTLAFWGMPVEKPQLIAKVERLDQVVLAALQNKTVTQADLEKLKRFPKLAHLLLYNSKLPDGAFKQIAALKPLRIIEMGNVHTTDASVKQLAKLQQLQSLDLAGAAITDASLKHLAACKQLKTLNLKGTGVTSNGIAELRKQLPGLKIEH